MEDGLAEKVVRDGDTACDRGSGIGRYLGSLKAAGTEAALPFHKHEGGRPLLL